MHWDIIKIINFLLLSLKWREGTNWNFQPTKLRGMLHIHRILSSWPRPSVMGQWNFSMVHESGSLWLVALSLRLVPWSLVLAACTSRTWTRFWFSLRLVTWCLKLGACGSNEPFAVLRVKIFWLSVWDTWHSLRSCPSMRGSPCIHCLGPEQGRSCLQWTQSTSRARI